MTVRHSFPFPFYLGAVLLAAWPAAHADEIISPAPLSVTPTPAPGETLTLEAAMREALAQSPALRVITADVEAAQGEVITARTKPAPELSFMPAWKRTREGDASHNEFKGTVVLSRTFLFPGKRALLTAIAERNVELRRLAIEGLRFQLAAAVRKVFYELLAAQSTLSLRQQQLESAQTFQQAATKRAESGYASDFEAVRSQGDVIAANKLLQAAQGRIAAARVELNALLGRDPFARLEVTGKLDDAALPRALPDLLAAAQAQNPGLHVLALKAEINGLAVRKAQLARRPDFSIGPSLEYSKSEQVLGISATVALPDKNYGRGEILTANAEQRRALAEIEVLKREVAAAVTKAATQLATALGQLALYSPGYLDQFKVVVDRAERGYAQNATSLLIYLDAKRTYFDALSGYYDAVADVAASRAELESAIGASLDPEPTQQNR